MPGSKDVEMIRELASRVAEIAALPVQEETRALWRRLNARDPVRPMVMIDQVCWNEMNIDDELTLQCTDTECRMYEQRLQRILYQWQHFPVDMVVEPFVRVDKAIRNTGFGMAVHEQVAVTDPTSAVVGHQYENQFQSEDDLQKIRMPEVSHDAEETDRRLEIAHELFDGLLEVRPSGAEPYLSLWDPIAHVDGCRERSLRPHRSTRLHASPAGSHDRGLPRACSTSSRNRGCSANRRA